MNDWPEYQHPEEPPESWAGFTEGSFRLSGGAMTAVPKRGRMQVFPVTKTTPPVLLWLKALQAADGDPRRIVIISASSLVVMNTPRLAELARAAGES